MWFKSESRGRSHGEHKSNSEGGDFQNIKIIFQKIKIIVWIWWWWCSWWLQRCEFTVTNWQRSLRKREVALSRINIYIVYIIVTCHTIRWQFDFIEMMSIILIMIDSGLMMEMMMFILMAMIMMALMKLFPVIPAKWIMEMDVCRDFKQNKSWRAKNYTLFFFSG